MRLWGVTTVLTRRMTGSVDAGALVGPIIQGFAVVLRRAKRRAAM